MTTGIAARWRFRSIRHRRLVEANAGEDGSISKHGYSISGDIGRNGGGSIPNMTAVEVAVTLGTIERGGCIQFQFRVFQFLYFLVFKKLENQLIRAN